MRIESNHAAASLQLPVTLPPRGEPSPSLKVTGNREELRERFTQFVGEAFFGQMIKAMRATVGKPAYFHGGRAEEVFQGQLDQTIAQDLAKSTGKQFTDSMFALSALTRR